MQGDLPSGVVTFVFTDVEGSTKLLKHLGTEGYAAALAEHRHIVRTACVDRGGVEVDTQGDAFFLAFVTPGTALEAAQEITDRLTGTAIAVRIGLHTGKPLRTEEGYVGEDIHLAARVASSAHGGQIVLSYATRNLLDDTWPLIDLGEHRLKDISEPVTIYQLGGKRFPPLKTLSNTNLPRPVSSFVGREHELARLLTRIRSGARLVTLTGPGGSGKTRLALEAAALLVPEYAAGVFWVWLAPLRDPALVTASVAQVLGAKEAPADHIGERQMLLLLDNFEQVVDAAPKLATLLQSCPNLTVLVTSRELLRLQGEVQHAVPPLEASEAVMLFCTRAQMEPTEKIGKLCRHLDNLPLAVELAAARATALSPGQILERISQRLDLLRGGRDAEPRQQTLRATIEWSCELLSADERRLFWRLSVFSGGCTLEAAEAIAEATLDNLESLVEKNLVRLTDERYWMLETIKEFASELLNTSGEAHVLQSRHATYFRKLAEDAAGQFHGQSRALWFARLEREHGNLRTALDFWVRDPDVQLGIAASIWPLWWQLGSWSEAQHWLDAALAASRDSGTRRIAALEGAYYLAYLRGDAARARSLLEETLELARRLGDREGIAYGLHGLANLAAGEADIPTWLALDEESLEFSRGLRHELYPLGSLGWIAFAHEDDYPKARTLLEKAIEVGRRFGDEVEVARELARLATVAAFNGDVEEALAIVSESVELGQRLGASAILANNCLLALAALQSALGDSRTALRLLSASEALVREMGSGPAAGPVVKHIKRSVHQAAERQLDASEIARCVEAGHSIRLEDALAEGLRDQAAATGGSRVT